MIGHTQAKEIIVETVLKPLLSDERSLNDSRTCLIASFAGTGKTMLLKEIEHLATHLAAASSSSHTKIHYQHVNAAEMMIGNRSSSSNNSENNRILGNVVEFFSSAIQVANADLNTAVVLCIDDIDCFLGVRHVNDKNNNNNNNNNNNKNVAEAATKMLDYLDEISLMARTASSSSPKICVFCTSVHPTRLDVAAIHRFSRRLILNSLFTGDELFLVAKNLLTTSQVSASEETLTSLKKLLVDTHIDFVQQNRNEKDCYFFTPAEICGLVREACMQPLRELIARGRKIESLKEEDVRKELIANDFQQAFATLKGTLSRRDVEEFEKWKIELGVGQNLNRGCSLHFR